MAKVHDLCMRLYMSEDAFRSNVRGIQNLDAERQAAIPSDSYMREYALLTGHVYKVQDGGRTVWFKTQEGTWFTNDIGAFYGGIVYTETGEPFIEGEYEWDHLYGPWWVWRWVD